PALRQLQLEHRQAASTGGEVGRQSAAGEIGGRGELELQGGLSGTTDVLPYGELARRNREQVASASGIGAAVDSRIGGRAGRGARTAQEQHEQAESRIHVVPTPTLPRKLGTDFRNLPS